MLMITFLLFATTGALPVSVRNVAENNINYFDNYEEKTKKLPPIQEINDIQLRTLVKLKESENVTKVNLANFEKKLNVSRKQIANSTNDTNRLARQNEEQSGNGDQSNDNNNNDERNGGGDEEEEEVDDEENMNMITGLISALLGGFSRPDGGIDVEAITGLLGSLSSQNDDGTYDFQGLTDLLQSYFGDGGDDGGGSDVGAFLGGILGALIKGVANPPGAKGAGKLVGGILGGILPALSGPVPANDDKNKQPPPNLDSGSFLTGLLKSLFGSSGGRGTNRGSRYNVFKALFSGITSIFTSSSSYKSNKW